MYRYAFIILFAALLCRAQNYNINTLEQEVIKLNRSGRQKESQDRIIKILSQDVSAEERIQLNLLLANTFRSINDYSSAIYYLNDARRSAAVNNINDSVKASLDAELAFSTFDNNDYAASEKIIARLKDTKYRYLDNESRAYMIMQEGYIRFLSKNYNAAEKCFLESLGILRKYSSCNQPAVMVKQIQLYAAMNETDKSQAIYDRCISLAEKCRIFKYKIYATEELAKVYREKKNKDRFFYYTKLLDSFKVIDRKDQRLSLMHASNQDYMHRENTDQATQKKMYLLLSIIIGLGSIIFFVILRKKIRKKTERYENLISSIRITSENGLQDQAQKKKETEDNLKSLSKRQKDIVIYALEGLTNKEIAQKLCLSEATIKYHFTNIFEILQIKNRKDLFKLFIKPDTLS